jgi:hypothetical protein
MIKKYFIGGLVMLVALAAEGQKTYPVAIWLVPASEQQRQIQEAISRLAATYSTPEHKIPTFQPHVTLCAGELEGNDIETKLQALFDQVDVFASRQKELSLAVRSAQPIDQRRRQWSQFLFLALENDVAPAEALDLAIAKQSFPVISNLKLSTDANQPAMPMLHLSLMYNGIESSFPKITQEVVSYKDELPHQIILESIAVVAPRSGDWRDILKEHGDANGDWDILHVIKLLPPIDEEY